MPVAVAIAIRYIIMAAAQLGLWTLLEKTALPLFNRAIQEVMELFGVPEEEAQDIMANEVLRAFESVGIFAVTLRTKLPIKLAERLGFTTKGWAIRTLKPKTATTVATTAKVSTAAKVATSGEIAEIASTIAKTKGLNLSGVKSFLGIISAVIGIPTAFFFAFAQYIDFANWQGPYQKTFQNLLAKIGIHPDSPMPNARAVSADVWKQIYATIEALGPVSINFPFSDVNKPYSRLALADLVDEVAAKLRASGGTANVKNILGIILPLVQLGGTTSGASALPPSITSGGFKVSAATQVKAFSGVLSQGVIGANTIFQSRPDDLIENMAELQQAINNNVAPWISSLPGRISYEVKTANTVIVEGLRLVGQAHRIQSGTNTDGTPRYKTIYNKFATVTFYYIKDGDERMKLDTIILGPTNAVSFQPSAADLLQIGASIDANVVTHSTDEISTIVTATPTTVIEPASPDIKISEPSIGYTFIYDGYKGSVSWNTATVDRLRKEIASGTKTLQEAREELYLRHVRHFGRFGKEPTSEDAWANQNPNVVMAAFDNAPQLIDQMLTSGGSFVKEFVERADESPPKQTTPITAPAAPVTSSAPTPLPSAALSASTLFDFYTALGKSFPVLTSRANLYQSLGLGQAGLYAGTAEQNNKLLSALKTQPLSAIA